MIQMAKAILIGPATASINSFNHEEHGCPWLITEVHTEPLGSRRSNSELAGRSSVNAEFIAYIVILVRPLILIKLVN